MTKYDLLSDLELLDLFKAGNHYAFAEIYERYFGLLYIHAYNRLRDKDEAKDVVQELFSDLWSGSHLMELKSNFSNYLYTSIKNRVLNVLAHKNVQEKYKASLFLNEQTEALTDHLVRERQLKNIIEKEIEALPPRMKSVFLMSRKENMTYIEIAKTLDISEKSVRSHVKNALRILRVKLGLLLLMLWLFY